MSFKWTESPHQGDNGSIEKWWSPPESRLQILTVLLYLLRETDDDEEAAFKSHRKTNRIWDYSTACGFIDVYSCFLCSWIVFKEI